MDPAVLAAFLQMQQQVTQLQQQLQQQQQPQQQQLQQQQPAAPAAANRPAAPRIPNPPLFDGRAAALDDWLSALRQQFRWYDAAMAADADRIRFAITYLKGPALDWWEHLGAATPSSWTDLEAALRARFQPVTSAESTRSKLLALSQGKAAVHDYIAAFRRLVVAVPDMSEADRLFQFTRGLAPAIATQLRVQGVATVDAAISMAARVGSLGELIAPVRGGATPAAAALGASGDDMILDGIEGLEQSTSLAAAAAAPGSALAVLQAQCQELLNAMKGDRGSHRSREFKGGGKDVVAAIAKRFGLTPEQVREHFDKGQCFNCDGTGHSSRACEKPPKRKN